MSRPPAKPLTPTSRREAIPAELFELLELDYPASEARGHGLDFLRVEVSLPRKASEAGTVAEAADGGIGGTEGAPNAKRFVCNATYTRISIGDNRFSLYWRSVHHRQAAARGEQNRAALGADENLLEEARYRTNSLGDIFKRHTDPSWKELIEQERGHSRLNL